MSAADDVRKYQGEVGKSEGKVEAARKALLDAERHLATDRDQLRHALDKQSEESEKAREALEKSVKESEHHGHH